MSISPTTCFTGSDMEDEEPEPDVWHFIKNIQKKLDKVKKRNIELEKRVERLEEKTDDDDDDSNGSLLERLKCRIECLE